MNPIIIEPLVSYKVKRDYKYYISKYIDRENMMKKDSHDFIDMAENYDYYLAVMHADGHNFYEQYEFYLELAKQYGDGGIVDIACGTGAILFHLAENGFDVDGSDVSEAKVDFAKQKAQKLGLNLNIFTSNMVKFSSNRKYSLAIIARCGFMHLTTSNQQQNALLSIRENLLPGGLLALNTFAPDISMQYIQKNSETHDFKFRIEHTNVDNRKEIIYNINTYDSNTQVMMGNWKLETLDDNGEVIDTRIRPFKMRQTYKVEMEHLIELCGYKVINVYEDYYKTHASSRRFIWVIQRID